MGNPGFSLFPMPPTPPANRRVPRPFEDSPPVPKLVLSLDDERSIQLDDDVFQSSPRPSSTLVPAPLKLRRTVDVPPAPLSAPLPVRSHSSQSLKRSPTFRAGAQGPPPLLPAPPPIIRAHSANDVITEAESARRPAGYQTPTRRKQPVSRHLSPEKHGNGRSSWRISEWLDVQGDVDHRKLSVYLGNILNTSFTINDIQALTKQKGATDIIIVDDDSDDDFFEDFLNHPKKRCPSQVARIEPLHRQRSLRQEALASTRSSKVYFFNRCTCPANTIICQCNSSEEFQEFKQWHMHKTNPSVSSTVCMLQIPRARFRTTLPEIEPTPPTVTSPPGLAYDSDDNEPETPSRKPITPPRQKGVRSFSRPFRPDSTTSSEFYHDPEPATPDTPELEKSPFLGSVSTMSTFSFDFQTDSEDDKAADHHQQSPTVVIRENYDDLDNEADFEIEETLAAAQAVITSTVKVKPIMVDCRAKSPTPPLVTAKANTTVPNPLRTRPKLSIPTPTATMKYWAPRNHRRAVVRGLPANMQMHARVPRLVITSSP